MNPEAIKELMVKLGFDYDGSGGDDFLKQAKGIKTALFKTVGAIAGAVGAVSAFTVATSSAADKQAKSAKALGLSNQAFLAYQDGAEKAGMAQNVLTDKLGYFQDQLGLISNSQSSKLFQDLAESKLNISPIDANGDLKKAPQILNEIVAAISKVKDRSRRVGLVNSLLGDFGTWNSFVSTGGKQLKDAMKFNVSIGSGISSEDQLELDAFMQSWVDTKAIINQTKDELMNLGVDAMGPLIKSFNQWYVLNKDIMNQDIAGYFKTMQTTLGPTLTAIGDMLGKSAEGWGKVFDWVEFGIDKMNGRGDASFKTEASDPSINHNPIAPPRGAGSYQIINNITVNGNSNDQKTANTIVSRLKNTNIRPQTQEQGGR